MVRKGLNRRKQAAGVVLVEGDSRKSKIWLLDPMRIMACKQSTKSLRNQLVTTSATVATTKSSVLLTFVHKKSGRMCPDKSQLCDRH